MRHCLALDLKNDPVLIAQYEAYHRQVWPEVRAHLRRHGVTGMDIYRLGTRLVMVMETDDAIFNAQAMEQAAQTDLKLREWENLMWTFQAPTPWALPGQKWVPMECIYRLDSHDEVGSHLIRQQA